MLGCTVVSNPTPIPEPTATLVSPTTTPVPPTNTPEPPKLCEGVEGIGLCQNAGTWRVVWNRFDGWGLLNPSWVET